MMREFAGILAALLDPLKILAFGGLGLLFAHTKPKWLWALIAAAAFFVMVWATPWAHRQLTLGPWPHKVEPGFDLRKEDWFFRSEYAAFHLDYFFEVYSRDAMQTVMRNIDRYKADCEILTGSRNNYLWRSLCDEWMWGSTAIAGAIQFGLALLLTSYWRGWRFRPAEKAARVDAAVVGGAASILRVARKIFQAAKGYGARIKAKANEEKH